VDIVGEAETPDQATSGILESAPDAVLIDLKLGKFSHADAGQMHMYLNYAKAHWTREGENPPVGIILCSQKGAAQAHYALEGLPNKVLAARYQTLLPSSDQLTHELRRVSAQLTQRAKP
jgi:DNA-binding NarL/FixJ family response regulator